MEGTPRYGFGENTPCLGATVGLSDSVRGYTVSKLTVAHQNPNLGVFRI